MRSLTPVVVATALLPLLGTSTARAAPCQRPDLVFAFPPDGATAVPANAKLHASYQLSAEYLGEDVVVEEEGGTKTTAPATFDSTEGLLTISPTLVPGARYIVHWPSLRGINTASLGRGKDVTLTVGTATDARPPAFAGATDLSWDIERERDGCSDGLVDRYVFPLSIAAADDDGGRESLALLVFQTAGPTITPGTPQQILVTSMPPPGEPARVVRAPEESVGHVCFATIARDLNGNVSPSGSREACADTVAAPFFYGCSAAHSTGDSAPTPLLPFLAALVIVRRARRHRPRG